MNESKNQIHPYQINSLISSLSLDTNPNKIPQISSITLKKNPLHHYRTNSIPIPPLHNFPPNLLIPRAKIGKKRKKKERKERDRDISAITGKGDRTMGRKGGRRGEAGEGGWHLVVEVALGRGRAERIPARPATCLPTLSAPPRFPVFERSLLLAHAIPLLGCA